MSERLHEAPDEALPFRLGVFDPLDEDCPPRLVGPILPASMRDWALAAARRANRLAGADPEPLGRIGLYPVRRGVRLAIQGGEGPPRAVGPELPQEALGWAVELVRLSNHLAGGAVPLRLTLAAGRRPRRRSAKGRKGGRFDA